MITFVSSNASLFIGRDIFDSCYALKAIVVPEESEDAYRDNVIYDRTIVELITSQNPAEEETPEETPAA